MTRQSIVPTIVYGKGAPYVDWGINRIYFFKKGGLAIRLIPGRDPRGRIIRQKLKEAKELAGE